MNISVELKLLFENDQQDRASKYDEINIEKMRLNDEARLKRAKEIYIMFKTANAELLPDDFFFLAMLFQHGSSVEDYRIAFELSNLGSDKGCERCKWLSAASEDRYLLAKGEKQKWGTQFKKNIQGEWEQLPMYSDKKSGITDYLRRTKGIPERIKQLEIFLDRKDIKK